MISLALGKELVNQYLLSELARQEQHFCVRKRRTLCSVLARVAKHRGHLVGEEDEAAHRPDQLEQGTVGKGCCKLNLLLRKRTGSYCHNVMENESRVSGGNFWW